jgi:hypothetical protein
LKNSLDEYMGGRYLAWAANARRTNIERTLPGAVRYLTALSSGRDVQAILTKVADHESAYGETGVAFRRVDLTVEWRSSHVIRPRGIRCFPGLRVCIRVCFGFRTGFGAGIDFTYVNHFRPARIGFYKGFDCLGRDVGVDSAGVVDDVA